MAETSKVALITGASQGIGAALVAGLRAQNYRIVANSRRIDPSTDPDVVTVRGDVADPATARSMVDAALDRFGRIDTLVNNAGVFVSKGFVDFTAEDYAAVAATNLTGFFHVSQQALAVMLRQGSGHIVSMTTSLADQPIAGVPAALNALTKGGLNAVTRSLAIEYAQTGVRVNAVSLGIIDTPMHADGDHGFLAGLHPIGRMGDVDEVVEAVRYLDAATFITGEVLHLDGGAHAGRW
ncbi:SDR family NAD(P)-dependent oxidoreductase [Pelagibius sp.]|uniref:SDR family NAD(P)-dependent oxidoreductase n=1 Tax=Pelagibius sp. TaxID=1931238 RepID=UPI003B50472D